MKSVSKIIKNQISKILLYAILGISMVVTSCEGGNIPEIEITVSTVFEGSFQDGLAEDSKGNIYGSDFAGNTVYKLDRSGNVAVFANGFTTPNGIGINSKDEIYICDNFGNKIFKYDTEGTLLASFDAASPAGIKKIPWSNDMLFVEYFTNTINVLKEDGSITKLFEGEPINGPAGIAFDRKGNTYIGNFNDRKIYKFSDGQLEFVAQLPAEAENSNFLGFLTYAKGNLFATQIGEHRIYKINPRSVDDFEVFAGSVLGNADGEISEATFNFPNGILASRDQKTLYVSDAGTKNLRIISSEIKY
ncbi:SMP-30/gluconolactonase/LRE family protein [Aquimarina gracilis]|uniref:SMP-30/gluconolactonase/LRE family protein n=1 Tax=Aquimarina gracilis TaxID=874422 RepID=A0ABU5ZZS2_9FLAO|nr:SMP-30/gluconolactonase/LRE family protein [Aquimarina gracilis]MEB3347351.1 SMP-30/gluconolactonase/LRE family protein [Aquimarina gracilis]